MCSYSTDDEENDKARKRNGEKEKSLAGEDTSSESFNASAQNGQRRYSIDGSSSPCSQEKIQEQAMQQMQRRQQGVRKA